MIKDYITSKERIESISDKINHVIKRDSLYLALFVSIVIFYIIFITSKLG